MDERDKIIIAIVFSVVGFISFIIIVFLLIWFIIHRTSDSKSYDKTVSKPHRQTHHNLFQVSLTKRDSSKKKQKRRLNRNGSVESLPFNPPHLINQNVKYLDELFSNESSLSTNSARCYDSALPILKTNNPNRYYDNPLRSSIITSSSSLSTPIYKPVEYYQRLNSLNFFYLNELNHNLCQKQEKCRTNPLQYSQSSHQVPDLSSYDYYRPMTSKFMGTDDSLQKPKLPLPNEFVNTALIHNTHLEQWKNDSAILY